MDVSCSKRAYGLPHLPWAGQLDALPFALLTDATTDTRRTRPLTYSHICDNNPSGSSAYIRNCDALDVAYHLIYEGKGVSLDTIPKLTPVNLVRLDDSPAFTGHYMVDLLPLFDTSEATECFVSSGRQNTRPSRCLQLKPGDILGTASSPLGHP